MQLTGCFPAIVSPFRDGALDASAMAAHASWMVDEGVAGIVVCGTTGESATLTNTEKIRAFQIVKEAVGGRALVIGGVGNNCTQESLDFLTRVEREAELDAIMSVVPYYTKPPQAGIVAHFRAIADQSKWPVVIYNVPGRTVVGMTSRTMLAVAAHPNVVGIKEASADLQMDTHLFAGLPDGVWALSGDDATAMPFMAIGGHGVISVVGNIAPRLMSDLCRATLDNDLPRARQLHARVVRLHEICFSHASPLPTKVLTAHLGFGTAEVRLPLVPLDPELAAATIRRAEEEELVR